MYRFCKLRQSLTKIQATPPIRTTAMTLLYLLWIGSQSSAQPLERTYCPPPTPHGFCSLDRYRVSFSNTDSNVYTYERFEKGMRIDVDIIIDLSTEFVTDFVFGLTHDDEFLILDELSIEDTDGSGQLTEFSCYFAFDNIVQGGLVFGLIQGSPPCNIFLPASCVRPANSNPSRPRSATSTMRLT